MRSLVFASLKTHHHMIARIALGASFGMIAMVSVSTGANQEGDKLWLV